MGTRSESWGDAPLAAELGCPYRGRYSDEVGEADGAPPRRRRRWWRVVRRVRRVLAIVIALGVLGVVMFAGLLLVTPSVADAPALVRALAQAHRAPYPGPPVPVRFAASLVAAEDHRFYSEQGVDPFAVARLVFGPLTGRPDQGGSTLYQQLARMLYPPGWPGVAAEAEQAAVGVKLAISYPRAEILQWYSDVVYFGHGYYGLEEASCGYFGVPPARLTWAQAALLAGVVSAPLTDDPITHLAMARAREARVLARLVAAGMLTRVQAERAYRQPLHVEDGQHGGCGPRSAAAKRMADRPCQAATITPSSPEACHDQLSLPPVTVRSLIMPQRVVSLSVADADADGRCRLACEQPGRLDKLREQTRAGRQRSQQIAGQVQAAYQQAQVQWQQAQATWNRILACREGVLAPPAAKDMLQHSAYARLVARLETMPVIEQAKGVIMAQSSCSQDQAFDMLRRASQRLNMPVRDLAAKIVDAASRAPVSAGRAGSTVSPQLCTPFMTGC